MTSKDLLLKALFQLVRDNTNSLTITEIAHMTGLSRMTIYRYMERYV